MRLFIAAELPESVQLALAETSALLRGAVRGRYVATDSLHITLAFLGNVDAGRVNDLASTLHRACRGHGAIDVELGALGSFGKPARATLWQGLQPQGAQALGSLAQSVRAALREAGFDFDSKGFLPHITLMRAADLARAGDLPVAYGASGTIEAVALFRSDLSGERPRYEALERVRLGAETEEL